MASWITDDKPSSGSATGLVADTIADGTTTVAPSQNAVYDALASKQPLDTALTQIATATFANDDFVQKKAGSLTNRTIAQVKADLGVVSPVHSQEAKYGSSDTWGVPGDGYTNFGSFSASANTFYPIPFVVNSTITVTAIAAAQTGGGTAGNMRLLIYAADVDWQASGAPLLDTGSISTATNAVVLGSTIPVFTALFAIALRKEVVRGARLAGAQLDHASFSDAKLAGAELGCHWTELTPEHKQAMVLEVNAYEDRKSTRLNSSH